MAICIMCKGDFIPRNKKRPPKTCSKLCKNKLASMITTKQFSDPAAREHNKHISLKQKKDPEYQKKVAVSMTKRTKRWKEQGHPRLGQHHTTSAKASIGNGNRGRYKGKTWEEIFGAEVAEKRRKQNSKSMTDINETLLYNKKSQCENIIFSHLKLYNFVQNVRIGKYNVDFLNAETKTIIEFYGDFWHMNPKIYDADFVNPVTNILACDKWLSDKLREDNLKNLGYDVIVLWEKDLFLKREVLAEDAIKAAIKDYKDKRRNKNV